MHMDPKRISPLYRMIRWTVKKLFPKIEVSGTEQLPQESVIFVGNHCQMYGPVAAELYMPRKRYTWCTYEMMELKKVPDYAFTDFWSEKPRSVRWMFRLFSYLIAPLSVLVFNNADTIPVYKDKRMVKTFQQTVDCLRSGADVVIFPEQNKPYNAILCGFQEGFVNAARQYYKETGKALSFVPMYLAPKLGKLILGKPVPYNPDMPLPQERRRVCEQLLTEITELAAGLPVHTAVPYRNVPKSQYPTTADLNKNRNESC